MMDGLGSLLDILGVATLVGGSLGYVVISLVKQHVLEKKVDDTLRKGVTKLELEAELKKENRIVNVKLESILSMLNNLKESLEKLEDKLGLQEKEIMQLAKSD